jgi:hypothetical protein
MAKNNNPEEKQGNPLGNITISGGLNTDVSLVNQPPGTTRFVMTGVDETKEGDLGTITSEESNGQCYDLASAGLDPGYVPMGKVYIGNEDQLVFLANPNGNSAIVILDKECNLEVKATDENQFEKFGFKITQQIDATFRLRRGCERTVYWVDPKPRMFILDKEEEFKDDDPLSSNYGGWDIAKFNLFKTYKSIPEVTNIEVLDGSGILPPGSYNFSIRYLDADFNPTEFVTSTETIMIYNTPLTSNYRNIEGATKEELPYYGFPDSNKAIKITLDPASLDTTYPFYQLAITEANAGGGLISDTKFTQEISTRQPFFVYTGTNYESSGSQAEVTMFNNIIEKAQSIEQIENRLILGDIEGKQINYCNLQKYASRITADMITKEVFVSELDAGNSKDPSAHFHGIGYMPGEIYSFGIVYIFEDNSVSPVFHIPGKSPSAGVQDMYSTGPNVYPMTNIKNNCQSTKYIDNNTCGQDSFWGKDYLGDPLTDKKVRHHRFPLRTDYDIPFVEKVGEAGENPLVKNIIISVTKVGADIPLLCTDDSPSPCTEQDADFGDPGAAPGGPGNSGYGSPFEFQLEYTEDAISNVYSNVIDPFIYQGEVGDLATTADVEFNFSTGNIYANVVTIPLLTGLTEVFEDTTLNNVVALTLGSNPITGLPQYTGTSGVTELTYIIDVGQSVAGANVDLYKATVFGIKFSNINLPNLVDTDGQKIIGYYIVRNERKESDKTVLDSAVLLPTAKEKNFVSQGLIFPEYDSPATELARIKKDVLGFISPEHKFNNTQYSIFSEIIQQGDFKKVDAIKSRVKINDVADGSGYVSGKHKDGEKDVDGFSVHIKTRDNITEFRQKRNFDYTTSDIKEVFYLDALEDRLIEDSSNSPYDIFNLACDNKIGLLSLNQPYTQFNCLTALPYVYLFRDSLEPYSNFRLEPYYKESKNPEKFDILTGTSTCEIFNGDIYINSMRYVNSIYYDTRIKKRKGKTNAFGFILGAILVVIAVALTVLSLGATTPLLAAALVTGAGLAAGVATTLLMSGIKQDAWNKAYNVLYKQGLRTTITDEYLLNDIDPVSGQSRGNAKNPSDDEQQWLGDCVNLWFESPINMGLRHGFNDATPSYLKAPGLIEQGTTYPEWNREYFKINSVGSGSKRIDGGARHEDVAPTTALDFHMTEKLTFLDASRKSGRKTYGIALAEAYLINPDYKRRNKQKSFFHLGLEYDCCTDCVESFPHRWHWSEQAFQEELTDNFRMFLPNNYKDLEAETGRITDIFRVQNNLYIHTEEGLWHCPQTFQERITSDIVSFIGTGEYFSIPPRKMVDDNNSSAGNRHKWARTKTKYGVLFPSWKEKKWYLFNGESLQPISDNGNSNYFKVNMDFLVEQQYYSANQEAYPYSNNPSNPLGVGFLSTYDTNKERLIITKKDNKISNLPSQPYQLCSEGTQTIIFTNMAQTIADREADGWTYIGIEDCKMKFSKVEEETQTITVNQFTEVPNDIDIYIFYDTSGSFGFSQIGSGTITEAEIIAPQGSPNTNVYFPLIDASLMDWITNDLIPSGWIGNVYRYYDSSERWLQFADRIPLANRGKVLLISLTNEANNTVGAMKYHGTAINFSGQPSADYTADYEAFTEPGGIHSTFDQFIGINYPICTPTINDPETKTFVQHALAAVKGRNYTLDEVNDLPQNLYFSTAQWTALKAALQVNPYASLLDPNGNPGLEQWGWFVKADRSVLGNPASEECEATNEEGEEQIISPCQFAFDMNTILASLIVREEVEETIVNPVTYVEYEEGQIFVPQYIKAGWTMSYGLKRQEWKSWHPYIPSFYFHVQEKFYSWPQGSRYLWKHNRQGHYRTFYGVTYPFIVEYVDNPSPITTKVWDYLMFQTEAKQFDPVTQDYMDIREVTFNKVLFYNTEQISGVLTINPKQNLAQNYLLQQTQNFNSFGNITADRNERDWTLNDMRDVRMSTAVPMFIKDVAQLQSNYYIDKIVNPSAISSFKSWNELESFRDKFLVVRLIFDTFDTSKRLTFYYSYLQKEMSER